MPVIQALARRSSRPARVASSITPAPAQGRVEVDHRGEVVGRAHRDDRRHDHHDEQGQHEHQPSGEAAGQGGDHRVLAAGAGDEGAQLRVAERDADAEQRADGDGQGGPRAERPNRSGTTTKSVEAGVTQESVSRVPPTTPMERLSCGDFPSVDRCLHAPERRLRGCGAYRSCGSHRCWRQEGGTFGGECLEAGGTRHMAGVTSVTEYNPRVRASSRPPGQRNQLPNAAKRALLHDRRPECARISRAPAGSNSTVHRSQVSEVRWTIRRGSVTRRERARGR